MNALEVLHRNQINAALAELGGQVDGSGVVAHLLHREHPFRYPDENGATAVALVGDHPLRMTFFKQILSTCQCHRQGKWTPLRFYIVCEKPLGFLEQLIRQIPGLLPHLNVEAAPALEKECRQLLKDAGYKAATPYATVCLQHPADKLKNQWLKLKKNAASSALANYILLLNPAPEDNEAVARELAAVFRTPAFIGVGGAEDLSEISTAATCMGFSLEGQCTAQQAKFLDHLERRAEMLHTYYIKEDDQRRSASFIAESFREPHNRRSSIRAALSVDSTLHYCGLADCPESAVAFTRLLQAEDMESRATLRALLLMEHRNWQCFMLTEGWTCPTQDQQEKLLYTVNNPSHKWEEKGVKLHPCLADAEPSAALLPLREWTREDWDNENRSTRTLDPLDAMSVELHRLCNRRVRELRQSPVMTFLLSQIECQIGDEERLERYTELFDLSKRILDGEVSNDWLWQQKYRDLQDDDSCVAQFLKELHSRVRIAMERNAYRDYKQTDMSLLMAIPFLLAPDAVQVIYKLCSNVDWENVVSAVMLEPKELVLIYTPEQTREAVANKEQYESLFAARNSETTVTLLPFGQIGALKEGAVLDITGASAHLTAEALRHDCLSRLDVICYREHGLQNMTPNGPDLARYAHRDRWLTVRETLLLSGNEMLSSPDTDPLLALHRDYKQYFDVICGISPADWHDLTSLLNLCSTNGLQVDCVRSDIPRNLNATLRKLEPVLLKSSSITTVAQGYRIRLEYVSPGAKSCLTKAGNVLEALVYHTLLASNRFDDVRIGVRLGWYHGDVEGDQTTNEVDVICTKGLRTAFISCKKTRALEQQFYPEVWYEAHRFGVDAVPVLVTTCHEGFSQTHITRGERMGVTTVILDPGEGAETCARQVLEEISALLS